MALQALHRTSGDEPASPIWGAASTPVVIELHTISESLGLKRLYK